MICRGLKNKKEPGHVAGSFAKIGFESQNL